MERSNDERLLDLRALVRIRLERDLRSLADISADNKQLSLHDVLDEIHNLYVNYLEQDIMLNCAAQNIKRDDPRTQEELNRLRSIDT